MRNDHYGMHSNAYKIGLKLKCITVYGLIKRIQLKYIPEQSNTTEIYTMHIFKFLK